jgi:hypothetical protein
MKKVREEDVRVMEGIATGVEKMKVAKGRRNVRREDGSGGKAVPSAKNEKRMVSRMSFLWDGDEMEL